MSKIDLISGDWTDLVFEGRNKAYGAYVLRKGTSKRNLWSILFVVIVAVVAFIGISLNKMMQANKKVENTQAVELSQLAEKKEAKKKEKEVVKVQPEKVVEKVKSTIKFTPPVIKKDEEVKDDEQIDLNKIQSTTTTIGSFNVEGNDEVGGEVLKAKEEIAQPEPPKHEDENKVFDVVEQPPSFPGGMAALQAYLRDNIKYPVVAAENGIEGRVIVQFVVGKDGSISNVTVARSADASLDKEAVRVVKSMPKWTPGKQNGTTVNVKYTCPVTFRLQ